VSCARPASTLSFYETHAQQYFARTVDVDMSAEREAFVRALRRSFPAVPAPAILDAGCGSGRDAKAFLEAGCRVTAFDGSAALAQLASRHTGLAVRQRRFDELTERQAYHGVWACASLLHLPAHEFVRTLSRVRATLLDGGLFFLSLKEGEGARIEADGRFFAYYRGAQLGALLNATGFTVLALERSVGRMAQSARWVNALCRVPR
jgi:2-polyprenyl-3-methyl-5-hydroxy-6-metoxy-1,4-benzoquinol methylase